jgi:hypothetical protein
MHIVSADEGFARHCAEGIEDRLLANATAPQLPLDHLLALAGKVCHGQDHGPSSDRRDNP